MSETHIIKHLSDIVKFLLKNALSSYSYNDFDESSVCQILGIEEDNEQFENMSAEEFTEYVESEIDRMTIDKPGVMLLKIAYALSCDDERKDYAFRTDYEENPSLDNIYQLLCNLGYEMSDEEKALQNGTSELFINEED